MFAHKPNGQIDWTLTILVWIAGFCMLFIALLPSLPELF